MNPAAIVLIILLLVGLGVGGYFGYKKLWVPRQCNNQAEDTTLHVKTFMWDSKNSNCVANVCSDGYGDAATGGKPDSKGVCKPYQAAGPTYTELQGSGSISGKCGGNPASSPTNISTQLGCEQACNGCTGYDWNGSSGCDTFTNSPLGAPTASDTAYKCYQKPASK